MAETKFKILFEGTEQLRDLNKQYRDQVKVLRELKEENGETSDEYKKQLKALEDLKKQVDEQRESVKKQRKEYKELNEEVGEYTKKSRRLNQLRKSYKDLAAANKETTDEAQKYLREIRELDEELKNIDASVGQFQRNVGNYGSAFDGMSSIMSGNLAGLAAAFGAGGLVVQGVELAVELGQQVKEIVDDYTKLRSEIQTFTGAQGESLDSYVTQIKSISETFGVSQEEVTQAANSLTNQLTGDFNESLDLISKGFLAGANTSGEFLDQVREYPTFFNEAGFSGEQFIATITQQVKEGIFSDKGIDAIKEAELSLREMTDSTADALQGIGLSSEGIREQIEKEGIGAAIQTVSARLGEFKADSPEVGAALADIFKGAGEDAGYEFIASLADMDNGIDGLIDRTNELTVQQERQLQLNADLAAVQNEVTKELGGMSMSFDDLVVMGKTALFSMLLDVIEYFKSMWSAVSPIIDLFADLAAEFGITGKDAEGLLSKLTPLQALTFIFDNIGKAVAWSIGKVRDFLEYIGVLSEEEEGYQSQVDKTREAEKEREKEREAQRKKQEAERKKEEAERKKKQEEEAKERERSKSRTQRSQTRKKENEAEAGSVEFLSKKISQLNREIATEADENVLKQKIQEVVDLEDELERVKNNIAEIRSDIDYAQQRAADALLPEATTLETRTITGEILPSAGVIKDPLADAMKGSRKDLRQSEADVLKQKEEDAQAEEDIQKQKWENIENITQQSLDTINAMMEAAMMRELAAAGDNEAAREEIQRRYARRRQQVAIAEAAINGALAIQKIAADVPKGDFGVATALLIALQVAQTAAQIAAIRSQTFARGGLLEGRSHAQGGIPVNVNGNVVEAEGGEAIINKRSTAMFRPLLSEINARGGGVRFAQGGVLGQMNTVPDFAQNNTSELLTEYIRATNDRIDRLSVVADASDLVKKGVERNEAKRAYNL